MDKNEMINRSLSHATLRNKDLIPAFAEFLEQNFALEYSEIVNDEDYYYILEFGDYDSETAHYLLETLFDTLDEVAPDGTIFGAHEGDGSDFGFWRYEDDNVYFDKFDICEAYITLEFDYNVNGILRERASNSRRNMSTGFQLHRMNFKLSPLHNGYDSLSDNGKAIYNNWLYHNEYKL